MAQFYTQYHQYILTDVLGEYDALAISDASDGVIAPLGTAICVVTGTPGGLVDVVFRVLGEGEEPPEPAPTAVAAACDIDVPSGTLDLRIWDNGLVERHEFGSPQHCRVLVVVTDRDQASDPSNPPEVHHIWVQPVHRSRPRWRSRATDSIGESLRSK
jgi:hypothetical protein